MTYPTHARLTPAHIMLPSRINAMNPYVTDEMDDVVWNMYRAGLRDAAIAHLTGIKVRSVRTRLDRLRRVERQAA